MKEQQQLCHCSSSVCTQEQKDKTYITLNLKNVTPTWSSSVAAKSVSEEKTDFNIPLHADEKCHSHHDHDAHSAEYQGRERTASCRFIAERVISLI